jgi:hypothetical protein
MMINPAQEMAGVGIPPMSLPTPGGAMDPSNLYAMALGQHILGNPQLMQGLYSQQNPATIAMQNAANNAGTEGGSGGDTGGAP